MAKRSFDESVKSDLRKEHVLCIALGDSPNYIRRLFSNKEMALAAQDKLLKAHGEGNIGTWVRLPTKDEMWEMYYPTTKQLGYMPWHANVIDDDNLLDEAVEVHIRYFSSGYSVENTVPLASFYFLPSDVGVAIQRFKEIMAERESKTKNKDTCAYVVRGRWKQVIREIDKVESVEEAVTRFNKNF